MIYKTMDISTGHITSYTAEWLNRQMTVEFSAVIVYPKSTYGWFISLPEFGSEGSERIAKIPYDLLLVMAYARGKDCEWLVLDRDADENGDLPIYEW